MPFALLHFKTSAPSSSSAAFSGDAENAYTRCTCLGVVILALNFFVAPLITSGREKSPHELYDALVALRPDPAAVYKISAANRLELRRADLLLSFEKGKLAFF